MCQFSMNYIVLRMVKPVRKGPAEIQVYLNTCILKKILVDFFLPHMRWNTGGKLYIVTKCHIDVLRIYKD